MNGKRVILIGATGMVGGCALRICLDDADVSRVTVVGRRSTGVEHLKLREVIHDDFLDYAAVADALEGNDAALFCLGAYTGAVPDEELRRVTVDLTVAFAEALRKQSPQAAFCLLGGQGSDLTERSWMAFARYKGMAENALMGLGFPRLYLFRPGYIHAVTPRREPTLLLRVSRILYPIVSRIYPNIGISSEDLARVMVHAGLHGTGDSQNPILENRDIRSHAGL